MKGRVHWYHDSLTPKMAVFSIIMEEAIEAIMEEVSREIEDYAKSEAPWNDRTGAARSGLQTSFENEGNLLRISLFHTVDYGIWLEVRWNGRYAIIQPTIERYGPILMGALGATYDGMP